MNNIDNNKKITMYNCPNCGKQFKIKRGNVKMSLWQLRKWLEKAQCPFCGKKLR